MSQSAAQKLRSERKALERVVKIILAITSVESFEELRSELFELKWALKMLGPIEAEAQHMNREKYKPVPASLGSQLNQTIAR
jgi:hypothetical protein